MRLYVDIILSGRDFSPPQTEALCGVSFKKAVCAGDWNARLGCKEDEGYAVLSSEGSGSGAESAIDCALTEYEKIFTAGEERLGIERSDFWLYIECLQNSFTLETSRLAKISCFFSKMNITYIQEN